MARRKKVYEGKAKILYEGPEPGTLVQYFKDDATAFNAEKKDVIDGKGVLNNRLSEFFMTGLNQLGVPTHFMKRINMREQLIRSVDQVLRNSMIADHGKAILGKAAAKFVSDVFQRLNERNARNVYGGVGHGNALRPRISHIDLDVHYVSPMLVPSRKRACPT